MDSAIHFLVFGLYVVFASEIYEMVNLRGRQLANKARVDADLPPPPVPPKCDCEDMPQQSDDRLATTNLPHLHVVNEDETAFDMKNRKCKMFCMSVFIFRSGEFREEIGLCSCHKDPFILENTGPEICPHSMTFNWNQVESTTFTKTQNCDYGCRLLNHRIHETKTKTEMHFGVNFKQNDPNDFTSSEYCACFPNTHFVYRKVAHNFCQKLGKDADQEEQCNKECRLMTLEAHSQIIAEWQENEWDVGDEKFNLPNYRGYYVPIIFRHRKLLLDKYADWPCQCYDVNLTKNDIPYIEYPF